LTAVQVDLNFWILFSALQALQNSPVAAGIDYINQPNGGNLFFVHLTNHAVLGPFIIPTSQWNPRGPWVAVTAYAAYDVVSNNGSLYLITIPHTSGSTFSPFATDGSGHLLYNLLLQQPTNEIPVGGTPGQRLAKSTTSPYATQWVDDHVRLHLFIEGQPTASELMMQYAVVDHMFFPLALAGSAFYQQTPTVATVVYSILKNGASIGTVTFAAASITVAFPAAITCVPGDVITLTGPPTPDAVQANISFTLVATLTL